MILLTMIFNAVVSLIAIIGIYLVILLLSLIFVSTVFSISLDVKWILEGLTLEEKKVRKKEFLEDEPISLISIIISFIPTFFIVMEIKQYLP